MSLELRRLNDGLADSEARDTPSDLEALQTLWRAYEEALAGEAINAASDYLSKGILDTISPPARLVVPAPTVYIVSVVAILKLANVARAPRVSLIDRTNCPLMPAIWSKSVRPNTSWP